MRPYFLRFVLLLSALCAGQGARASHLFGADFYYEHIALDTYRVWLIAYGDCQGQTYLSGGFNSTAPVVKLYNGTSSVAVKTFTLAIQGSVTGVEKTPVCPSQQANTACKNPNNVIPGVMQFTYNAKVTLPSPYTSSSWRFRFEGLMAPGMGTAQAGRSNSITNIVVAGGAGGGSLLTLEARLNNTGGQNSSPRFTTLPTPFYCNNIAQQYNQGAVDPNGDALNYALVDGLIPTGTVTYNSPYSATMPLSAASGTFSFSTTTGQLNFTPNAIQRSLVVNRVDEYRNGTLVGTSMREMVFVVLGACNNTPAYSNIDSTSTNTSPGQSGAGNIGGVPASATAYNVCQGTDSIRFHIIPNNPAKDTIFASVQGLPAGATATILRDSTPDPDIIINWKTPTLPAGSYNFFVTYKDNGCPLSSTQTQAFSVNVVQRNEMLTSITAPTQCVHQALVDYRFAYGLTPRTISITQGTSVIRTYTDNSGTLSDSLGTGLYTVTISSAKLACPTTYQLQIVDSGVYPNTPVTAPVFYCLNDPAKLVTAIADSGAFINWFNASGVPLPGPPLPRTDTAGIFTYFANQRFKVCTSLRDTVLVYVTKRPIASIDGPLKVCRNDTAVFGFNGEIGVGPILEYEWDWDGANFAEGADGGPYRVHWNTFGTKTITLQVAENRCVSAIAAVDIEVKPTPYAGFDYPHEVCQYDTALLAYNTQPFDGQQYTWDFDGASTVTDNRPKAYVVRWDTAGEKQLSLVVDLDGCLDTQRAVVTVHPVPNIRITNAPESVCIGDKIFVVAESDGAVTWRSADPLLTAQDGRPYYQILKPSLYKAFATSSYGCVDSAEITYSEVQPCCQFSYPTAFTPSTKGRNSRFHVVTHGNQTQFELSIYNRWGQRVYYGIDASQGWDGTVNNDGGTPCSNGTYFYFVKAKCYTGYTEEHKGEVLLIR